MRTAWAKPRWACGFHGVKTRARALNGLTPRLRIENQMMTTQTAMNAPWNDMPPCQGWRISRGSFQITSVL